MICEGCKRNIWQNGYPHVLSANCGHRFHTYCYEFMLKVSKVIYQLASKAAQELVEMLHMDVPNDMEWKSLEM